MKNGSNFDMLSTLRPHNILPMAAAGLQNLDLTLYLLKELAASREKKLEALKEFIPDAKGEDWTICTAGQRVQIMKKDPNKVFSKLRRVVYPRRVDVRLTYIYMTWTKHLYF